MNTINTETLINFLLQQQKSEKTINISLAYSLFLDHVKLNNRAGTLKSYKAVFKPVLEYFDIHNITSSHEITDPIIDSYIKSRLPFVKNNTINKEICSLKTMLNVMIEKGYIDHMNFKFKKLKVIAPEIAQIDPNDIKRILNYFETSKITVKYKLIFLLILTTGIRTTELLNIKNKNIDLEKKMIFLDFTKTHHTRFIYLVDDIIPLVSQVKNSNTYLFNDENDHQLSDNALRLFFKHLKRDVGVEVLSPHKLRHFYATNVYKKSLDIYLVSNLLGHTNIKTTQIYLDINEHENQKKNSYYNPLNDFAIN